MRVSDLDYDLPPHLIAQSPAAHRDDARLMVTSRSDAAVRHRHVRDLPELLRPGDLLVFNDTRVLPARFYGRRGGTAGQVEGLYLGSTGAQTWHVMLKSGGKLTTGEQILLDDS